MKTLMMRMLSLVGCLVAGQLQAQQAEIPRSLKSAAQFLISQQAADGAWHSDVYGVLREGPALTPSIAAALFLVADQHPEARAAYRKGADYLLTFVGEDGTVRPGARE